MLRFGRTSCLLYSTPACRSTAQGKRVVSPPLSLLIGSGKDFGCFPTAIRFAASLLITSLLTPDAPVFWAGVSLARDGLAHRDGKTF